MTHSRFMATVIAALGLLSLLPLSAVAQTNTRLSVGASNTQTNADSYRPKISADGRFATYSSDATNLITGDTNGQSDIFITEISTRITRRVSHATGNVQATGGSFNPVISGDGRYIAFQSLATNLVTGDTNAKYDIFVRDTVLNITERVSVGTGGVQSNGDSEYPVISRDGRYIAFESVATNLVTGDTNADEDIFLYDRLERTTTRVSISTAGAEGNNDSINCAMSANGRVIAFSSNATNLVTGDINANSDVFVRNLAANTTTRISISTAGAESDDISGEVSIFVAGNGQSVAFDSYATTLVTGDTNGLRDVFVRDLAANTTARVSVSSAGVQSDEDVYADAISDDGRYILMDTLATTLVSGDTNDRFDTFLRDRQTNTTSRVSLTTSGGQADDDSTFSDMTPDANSIVFVSYATNLITGDTNNASDIFVRSPLQTTAEVRGTLTLQSIVPSAPSQLITFIFRGSSGDLVRTASVNPSGAFVVNGLPRATYTVLIKGGSYLAAKITVDATAGNVTIPNVILLRTGDANGDNFADIADLSLLIASYNKSSSDIEYNVMADFNLDGFNDIGDLTLLITNYNQQGEVLP